MRPVVVASVVAVLTIAGSLGAQPLIGPGETFEVTFLEAGEYAYHCTPHPFMTAVIRVVRP